MRAKDLTRMRAKGVNLEAAEVVHGVDKQTPSRVDGVDGVAGG